ncbi:MAG TPA: GNAT family N-acetyltransferase [Polyangiaceae bacterium]
MKTRPSEEASMQVDVTAASRGDAAVLANLFQYYAYDMTEIVDIAVDPDGRFVVPSLDAYWSDSWRHPYIVRAAGNLAGFALLQKRSRITGDENTWDVAEFFVMRKYRRRGVGEAVAARLFDAFRGRWEVRQMRANHAAIAFWRRVISTYTQGHFSEELYDDHRWRGPVQSFEN